MSWIAHKKVFLFLFVIIIIASFLRLYNISSLPVGFYGDEAMYATNGLQVWRNGGFQVFYPENFGREGLWPNIIGFFILNWGNEPWVPRSIAAVCGILTVLGLYFLTRELFRGFEIRTLSDRVNLRRFFLPAPELIALASAFFLATSVWHIIFSRIGFRAILAPLFLVWSLYFALIAFREASTPSVLGARLIRRSDVRALVFAVLGGLFFGLGFHTYIAFRAMPLLLIIMFLLFWVIHRNRESRIHLVFSGIIFTYTAILVFLPLGLYFISSPQDFLGRTSAISIFNSDTPLRDLGINIIKTLGMFNVSGDYNLRHNYPGRPELFWPVGIVFLIGIILSVVAIVKRKTREYQHLALPSVILMSWFLIAFLPTVISNEGIPHALRSLLLIPPAFIFAGMGVVWLYGYLATKYESHAYMRKILSTGVALFIPILILEAYVVYFVMWGNHPALGSSFDAKYVEIGRYLNSLPQDMPKYVITNMALSKDFRAMPVAIQPLLYVTDTLTAEDQVRHNLFYVLKTDVRKIPPGSFTLELP